MSDENENDAPLFGGETEDGILAEKPWFLKTAPKPRQEKRHPEGVTSPTRIASAQECALKHVSKYRDKRASPSGPEALVGKLVHGAYDDAGARRVSGNGRRKAPPRNASVEELLFLLEHQEAQLAREKDLDYQATDEMFAEARGIIQGRGPVDFGHAYSTEQQVEYRVPGRIGLKVGGKIDRVDLYHDKSGAVETVVIVDYKTDRALWSDEKLASSPQPATYLGWARREWPKARSVLFELDLVRLNKKQRIAWTPEYEAAAFSRIVATQNLMATGYDKPTVGEHCRFCPYRDGDEAYAACHAYVALVERSKKRKTHEGGLVSLQLSELLREYYASNELFKVHKQRRSDLKAAIEAKLGAKRTYRAGLYTGTLSATTVDPSYADVIGVLLDIHEVTGRSVEEIAAVVCEVKHRKLSGLVADITDDEKRARLGTLTEGRRGGRIAARSLRVSRKEGLW
jgi:RecB family exonuclease